MNFSYAALATLQDANGKNHINGIENFWGYAKHRLSKFKGIKKRISYFILKSVNLDLITVKIQKPSIIFY